jgi:hypothetical protein
MIDKNDIPEVLETSLVCVLSAAVAAFGFLVVWLICTLAGFGRA